MKTGIETTTLKTDEISKIRRYALICAAVWSLLLSGLLISYIADNRQAVHEIGHSMALASFEKDLLFRRWASRHGGVYVPETAETPSNPYLKHITERDIFTPSGRRLTLLNPAYMSRQIFELAREQPDTPHGHITSLNPIRPENAPDPWERQALKLLEKGSNEVVEVDESNGRPVLRFMRKLVAEKPCLKCHEAQGYKEGDIRGGISVEISLVPIMKAMNSQLLQVGFIHTLIWLVGLGFIWFGTRKIIRTMTLLRNERNGLQESEERYRALFTRAGDGIFIMSTDGRLVEVNESFARMHGYSTQEMLQMGLKDLDTPEVSRMVPERMERILAGETLTFDVEHYHRDGHTFPLEVSASLITSGGESYVQCFHRDVTERKRAEAERLQLEEQFHHAQKLESLGVLAGGIAHDFNNILTVILGHCYMARDDLSSEQEFKASFQQVENAANRAAELCRQMLTYAGRNESLQSFLSLWLLVDEVVKMLQAAIKKNVTIEIDLDREVPVILGDVGQLQQVVMNLIINAAEAIGDSNGMVRVVLSKNTISPGQGFTDVFGTTVHSGSYACLEIIDTGCGMDEETKIRMFEPFYTTKFTGRGLGMSAVRGIIKSHKAALLLVSTPGVGTTFRVCFPFPETSRLAEPDSAASDLLETPVSWCSSSLLKAGGTILLVDDEQALRNMGEGLLKTFGFSVLTAQHGREALEIFRERGSEIDAILLDLIMPVMGGIEAYKELRRISSTVPVIICSGYSVDEVSDVIDKDMHSGFVHKPYKPEELRSVILKLMSQQA